MTPGSVHGPASPGLFYSEHMTPLFRGFLLIALVSLCAVGVAFSADVPLAWDHVHERTDGTPAAVTGYSIHFGTSPDALHETRTVSQPAARSATVTGLAPGVYYFCVKAMGSGEQSACSNTIAKTAASSEPAPIKAPTNLR